MPPVCQALVHSLSWFGKNNSAKVQSVWWMRSQRETEACLRSQAWKVRAEVQMHVYLLAELPPALSVRRHLSALQPDYLSIVQAFNHCLDTFILDIILAVVIQFHSAQQRRRKEWQQQQGTANIKEKRPKGYWHKSIQIIIILLPPPS